MSDFAESLRANLLRTAPQQRGLCVVPDGDGAGEEYASDADRVLALQHELDGLREAMASRAVIEQAKGIVMMCYGLPQDRAFTVLVRWSSLWNIKLRDVAATLIGLGVRDQQLVGAGHWLAEVMATALDESTPAREGPPS